jgi:hypothetical protein
MVTDNGDGTITDTSKNLMWQAADDGQERKHDDASQYCRELRLGGFSDWRLPSLDEFNGLLSSAKASGVADKVNTVYNRASNADYWTATQGPQSNVAYIADGTTMFKTNTYCVRAVRSAR